MLMHVSTSAGVKYRPRPKTPNLIHDVPSGVKITRVHVDDSTEACEFVSDGEPILISVSAIRRIRARRAAAA